MTEEEEEYYQSFLMSEKEREYYRSINEIINNADHCKKQNFNYNLLTKKQIFNYNLLTKKQIIRKIKINKLKPYIKKKNITKFKLNTFLKEKLLILLYLQEFILSKFNYYSVPYEVELKILEFL
jgi:hypothetical protein